MVHSDTGLSNSNVVSNIQPMPEGEILSPIRDDQGKFISGVSGNPDGRPKSRLFSEELKELLAKVDKADRTGAERLGRKMFDMADQDKDQWLALAAIKEIRDTTEGKPTQNMSIRGNIVMMAPDAVKDAAFGEDEPQ